MAAVASTVGAWIDRLHQSLGPGVVAAATPVAAELSGSPWRFKPHSVTVAPPAPGPHVCIALQADDGRELDLLCDPALVGLLVQRVLGVAAAELVRPTALSQVELGVVLFLASKLLPDGSGWTVRRCNQVDDARPQRAVHLLATLGVGDAEGWCRIVMPHTDDLSALDNTPVMLHVEGGIGLFAGGALERLAPGDWVHMNPCWLESLEPISGEVRLRPRGVDSGGVHAKITPAGLQCVEILQPHQVGRQTAPSDSAQDLVEVTLELGCFERTLGELTLMAVGDVLPCPPDFGSRGRLRVGDVAVAEGQLVLRDGAIGIEIASA